MPVDSRNVNHYLGRDLIRPQEMKFIHKTTKFWYTAANTSPECTGHFPHTEIGVHHSPADDERVREVAAVVCPCGVKIKDV